MEQKKLQSNLGLFLIITGITAFIISLFHRKSRQVTTKLVGIGGGMAVDYLTAKYLPRIVPQFAKVVDSNYALQGNKGGKSSKRQIFKRSNKSSKLVAL